MRGRIMLNEFIQFIDSIQAVSDVSYPAINEIAKSPDTPNDIRAKILAKAGVMLTVPNIDLLRDHTADQTVLSDDDAKAVRLAAISRVNELKITALLSAIEDPANTALTAVADAADVAQTIRDALNANKAELGNVDLSGHLNDDVVLAGRAATRLRAAAIQRRAFLNERLRKFNLIKDAIAATVDLTHLPVLAADATTQAVRTVLNNNVHLASINFAFHLDDQEIITNEQANELKRLIIEQRRLLEERERNFVLIRDAIAALNRAEDDVFDALTTVVNAGDVDAIAIRRALNQPHVRALLGNVDLTGQEALELKLSNDQAIAIHGLALNKRNDLIAALPDEAQKNAYKGSFKISSISDCNDAFLQAFADADENPVAVRTAYYNSLANPAASALHGHLNDETVLTDAATLSLRQQAIKKRSALRRAAIEAQITAKIAGNKDHLDGLLQAVGVDAIRQALHQNANLCNFHIENPAQLTDDDALAIRRAAINKHNELIGRSASVEEMIIPAAGTDEHTRLMAHIEQNFSTYIYRIARAEEKRRLFRHTQDQNASVNTEHLYQSLVNMRNQLAAYKAHLGSGAGNQDHLAVTTQNIDKMSALLKKIDEKLNKDITKIGHFSKDSQVVDDDQAEALVQQYLGAQAGVLNGALESNSPLKKTARFAAEGCENKVRVNHLEIQGKNKQTAHMVSVQKMVNNSYITELRFDPEKLNLSRDWFACIPNDDVLKWAIAEIENHRIGDPHPDRPIEIAGNMPEECVIALDLYCQYKNYSHHNFTKHTVEAMDVDQKAALIDRFKKNGDYLVGRHKHLLVSHTLAVKVQDRTEKDAVAAMRV